MPNIYDYDNEIVAEQLTPPVLRNNIFLSWLNVITKPIQTLWFTIFNDYKIGSDYDLFDAGTAYAIGERVIYEDKRVYECIKASLAFLPTDTEHWVLINDNFIGVDERIKYTSQIIILEYALNKWYQVANVDDQIYLDDFSNVSMQFVLGEGSATSSLMPNNSVNQIQYMGNYPQFAVTSYDFIVYVPIALFNSLGTNYSNRYNNISNFVKKYTLSGIKFEIDTY